MILHESRAAGEKSRQNSGNHGLSDEKPAAVRGRKAVGLLAPKAAKNRLKTAKTAGFCL